MFAKETYVQRRAQLKKNMGSGGLLSLGCLLYTSPSPRD